MSEAGSKPPRELPDAATRVLRSFVQRAGRLTPAQQRALDELWPKHGLEIAQGALDAAARFGRTAPLVLEIGFGNGEALIHGALHSPARDFIGIEVHKPGVGRALNAIESNALGNVRLYAEDAVEVLKQCIGEGTLDEVRIYFPDPWHKKRHTKRRLIDGGFPPMVRRALRPGGIVRLATDWEDYARQMRTVFDGAEGFTRDFAGEWAERHPGRVLTAFERKGERAGRAIRDLAYRTAGGS